MTDTIASLIARHPAPDGYTPRKSDLGELIDRYGVGNIPLEELHRANAVTPEQWAAIRAKGRNDARRLAADTARRSRQDAMADEWAASHGGR